ncbi:hypothetical protein N7492_009560 [Penicillium capsulatum]|uniref:NmrA-like domain-containing protein n=1 Tax=Penicillium capsulatum TaxID=69766 RepID=A0A9W9HUI8_9EURO|nr:hypothetical protein N7492_009560 [Penicillium capsulatum]
MQDPCNGSAQQVQINYEDIPSATRALERHNVHTIISAIGLVSEDTSQSQLNLIEAAEQSKTTERFIPTDPLSSLQSLLHIDPSIKWWLDAADSLKASSLQYTRVIPGFFMDYWGMPLARTNLQPYTFGVSLSHRVAIIPGDGNNVICMTYTYDMAKYVARLLELDEWPEFSVIVGDQVTYNQLLEMAEEIRGKNLSQVFLILFAPHH